MNSVDSNIHQVIANHHPINHVEDNSLFKEAKVLVVEDSEINQAVMDSVLKMFDIQPIFAKNGADCLEIMSKHTVDLIFMDLEMPILNGYHTTYSIRNSNKEYKNVPIVAVTGCDVDDDMKKNELTLYGWNDYIQKPIHIDVIGQILHTYLSTEKGEKNHPKIACSQPKIDKENIPGVDSLQGILRFGGKKDSYYLSLYHFARDLKVHTYQYHDFNTPENFETNRKYIHTLKGVSGNLAIQSMHIKTKEVEGKFLSQSLTENDFKEWIHICMETKKHILEALRYIEKKMPSTFSTKDEYFLLLKDLKDSLESHSVSSIERIVRFMKERRISTIPQVELDELFKRIDDYEYEMAVAIINRIQLYSN